jgi:magnesium-transporting ATPase (P-type)
MQGDRTAAHRKRLASLSVIGLICLLQREWGSVRALIDRDAPMVWLTVVVLAICVFYFWLIGEWFARVLVFLPMAFLGTWGAAVLIDHRIPDPNIFVCWLMFAGSLIVGVGGSWFIAGIPMILSSRSRA